MDSYKKLKIIWNNNCKNTEYKSLSIWNDYLVVSSKFSHKISLFNKNNGSFIKKLRTNKKFRFDEDPQEEIVINNYLFITDSKQSKCSIFDLENNHIISVFGFKNLKNPKYLSGYFSNQLYILHVFDYDTNNIIEFKLDIINNEINKLKSSILCKLEYTKLDKIYIDYDMNQILASSYTDSKLLIFNFNGVKINELNIDVENMASYNQYYLFTDKSKDSNMLHLYDKNNLSYVSSYYSNKCRYINDIISKDKDIFIIDNRCSILKIELDDIMNTKLSFNNLIIFGTLSYLFFNLLK